MLVETLTAIRVVAGAVGVAAGVALLLMPAGALRERIRLRRWMLEIDLAALLDRRRPIERSLYRHHRAFGALVIAGALASIAALLRFGDQAVPALGPPLGQPGVLALSLGAWVSALFAFVIGVFLLIRPSALKGLEAAANRWIEPFPPVGQAGVPAGYDFIGRLVQRFPRLVGALLLVAGLLCLDAFPR